MTVDEKRRDLVQYRLKQAEESAAEAEALEKSLNKAFELRQRGDYREYVELSQEQVAPFITDAWSFIAAVRTYLERRR